MTFEHTLTLCLFLALTLVVPVSRAQGCRIADAAIRYDHKNYIFVGPDYITLDDENREESVENKKDEWGGLERLDAAFEWKEGDSWWQNWYPVFLEGATYSYYSTFRAATYGPYSVYDEGDSNEDQTFSHELLLQNGVDAAATLGDKTYFIKCCEYRVYDHDEGMIDHSGLLEEYGLPCNVHAALHLREGILGVIKYDQLWEIDVSTKNVTGPVDANQALGLSTIRLCGEHEDAGESIQEDSASDSDE